RPTRREVLQRAADGFGAVALAALLAEDGRASDALVKPVRHHAPKAKSVIFLYMDGGPSQVDTFEYKPLLAKYDRQDPHAVFIVLNGGLIPPGGLDNFNSGFLPAAFQGSVFRAGDPPVANVVPVEPASALQRGKLDLLNKLDAEARERFHGADEIESAIKNYE